MTFSILQLLIKLTAVCRIGRSGRGPATAALLHTLTRCFSGITPGGRHIAALASLTHHVMLRTITFSLSGTD